MAKPHIMDNGIEIMQHDIEQDGFMMTFLLEQRKEEQWTYHISGNGIYGIYEVCDVDDDLLTAIDLAKDHLEAFIRARKEDNQQDGEFEE